MTRSYYVQSSIARITRGSPRQEPDPRNKTSRSHYKILSKLTEIYLRWLGITSSYSMQNGVAKSTL